MTDLKKMKNEGSDVCNEISLCKHNIRFVQKRGDHCMMLVKKDEKLHLIFGRSTEDDRGNYIGFHIGILAYEYFNNIIADLCNDDFLIHVDSTMEEWGELTFFEKLFDLYRYCGEQKFSHYDRYNKFNLI